MTFKRLNFNWKRANKGQSFVELTMVLVILLTLLAGMVEFGNLLNQYINVVDGAREGARFASNDNPFGTLKVKATDGTISTIWNYEPFFLKIYEIVEGQFDEDGNQLSKGAINPLVLNPANGDDIVVSFFTIITNNAGTKSLVRCVAGSYVIVMLDGKQIVGCGPSGSPTSRYNKQTSKFSDAQILALVDGTAPSTGLVLVEVFYAYNQILKLFSFTGIPDPVNLHAYSIMPLSAAEPTPTHSP
jgi:hypothetical protein